MNSKFTIAPDIEAITEAIGRKNSLLNNGIDTTVRYMITARMKTSTKLIWNIKMKYYQSREIYVVIA